MLKGGKKEETLYNVIFPIWFLLYFSPLILFTLIGNYLIDWAVLALGLRIWGVSFALKEQMALVFRCWIAGFLADGIGAIVLTGLAFFSSFNVYPTYPISSNLAGFAIIFAVIGLCGLLVGIFDYFILRKHGIDRSVSLRVAGLMGIITAPWTFLLPTNF